MSTETKSLSVNKDVYLIVKKKQSELIEKSGNYVQMTDITDMVIKNGINNICIGTDNKLAIKEN